MASADPATRLAELQREAAACNACPLHEGRTNSVFGAGSSRARLMFVGEAPGYHEDRLGEPFVGQAGKLLDKLLASIGLKRGDVYIANVLKCRPPNNRDPQTAEIEKCRGFLEQQIGLISPAIVCTLGNFSTRLLSGQPHGISRVHGRPQAMPGSDIRLYPVYHPAAALYTPANLKVLEEDFSRLAGILEANHQAKVEPSPKVDAAPAANPQVAVESTDGEAAAGGDGTGTAPAGEGMPGGEQLGLF